MYDKLYLIMEFVENKSIDYYIKKGTLTLSKTWSYFRDLITGLEYCHKIAGVIHRDIKPENLLIDKYGKVKIADFGVSYLMDASKNDMVKTTAGSHYFLAPEVITKEKFKGEPSDIWACGIALYYMVKGSLPFDGTSVPNVYKLIIGSEPSYKDIPVEIALLIQQILKKQPEDRITLESIKVHDYLGK